MTQDNPSPLEWIWPGTGRAPLSDPGWLAPQGSDYHLCWCAGAASGGRRERLSHTLPRTRPPASPPYAPPQDECIQNGTRAAEPPHQPPPSKNRADPLPSCVVPRPPLRPEVGGRAVREVEEWPRSRANLARCLAFHSRGASCKAADGEAGPRSAVARPTWRSSPHRQSGRARFRQFSVGPLLCRQPPGLDGVATQSDSSFRGCQPRARAPALSFGGLSARTRTGCRPPVAPQTPTAAAWAPPPLPAAPSDRAPPPSGQRQHAVGRRRLGPHSAPSRHCVRRVPRAPSPPSAALPLRPRPPSVRIRLGRDAHPPQQPSLPARPFGSAATEVCTARTRARSCLTLAPHLGLARATTTLPPLRPLSHFHHGQAPGGMFPGRCPSPCRFARWGGGLYFWRVLLLVDTAPRSMTTWAPNRQPSTRCGWVSVLRDPRSWR